jgi:hypothetical protein
MDFNASIIDQRLTGLLTEHVDFFVERFKTDEPKKRSACFVVLCMMSYFDISFDEACDYLTEGGNDAGVDGIYFSEPTDTEFKVILFQGKYKQKLDGETNFAENDIIKAIHTIQTLFDPVKQVELNPHIKHKIEEIRSLILNGYIPNITFVMCNNGLGWTSEAQNHINQSGFNPQQVKFCHFNHDNIINILRATKTVPKQKIQLTSKSLLDSKFDGYRRVVIGKVHISEIAHLFDTHGDILLEKNIRRYLGTQDSRVNAGIYQTLADSNKRKNFYFLNNGITVICTKIEYNELQAENNIITISNMQIINGGQTCKTIHQAHKDFDTDFEHTYVLVRIYELSDDDQDFINDITYATNSQNPVDLRDLKSNDDLQKNLEIGIKDLGYTYKRQRETSMGGSSDTILSSAVAESVFAIWRKKPHTAKFNRREYFGKFYAEIFETLSASQAIIAVLIFRMVENERKRLKLGHNFVFTPYASHYIAMLIGDILLKEYKITLEGLNHKNFHAVHTSLEKQFAELYKNACDTLTKCLHKLYGNRELSLQQLSATFRRGDLLEILHRYDLFDFL